MITQPSTRRRRTPSGLVALAALVAFGSSIPGCSTFDQDWSALVAQPRDVDGPPSIEGPWTGGWQSGASGQKGELRWIVTRTEDGRYVARRQTKYALFFKSEHLLPLDVSQTADGIAFQGEVDLGSFGGGVFRYHGAVTGNDIKADFRSQYDYGTYTLTRP